MVISREKLNKKNSGKIPVHAISSTMNLIRSHLGLKLGFHIEKTESNTP
jgi:hypothetical protein